MISFKKMLGLLAVGGLMAIAAPSERAQAVTLSTPAAAAPVKAASDGLTTQVQYRHHHHGHRPRHYHRPHRVHRHHHHYRPHHYHRPHVHHRHHRVYRY